MTFATQGLGGLEGAQLAQLGRMERQLRGIGGGDGKAVDAAEQLEALFATMLVREMRRALPEGFFGGGSGADIYEGWLDEHIGSTLARDGALNLAGMVKAQLAPGGTSR